MNVIKKLFVIVVALIGFGFSANAQYINATIGGQTFSGKAEKRGNYGYFYVTNGGRAGVAIVYNEQSGKATIAYLRGTKEWYIGEANAVLSTSNVGIRTLRITRSCNLYYANANSFNLPDYFDSSVLRRLLGVDVRSSDNYYSCSEFTVEW